MASNLEARRTSGGDRLRSWIDERAVWWNRICVVVIVFALLGIAWSLPIRQLAAGLQEWARTTGPWGAAIYVATFVLVTVCCLPTWPMPFVAGAAFGPWRGALLASGSCVLAAAICFAIARGVGRTSLRSSLEASPRMRALEHTVQRADWKIVAAVRVSHFLPFGMQNYAFGLTRIRFSTFVITTWAVTLPGIFLQAYLGHLGFASVEAWQERSAADWQTWGLRFAGLAAIAAAVIYIGHLGRSVYRTAVRAELEKELEAEERAAGTSPKRRWIAILLAALAILLVATATAAALSQEALREYFEPL
ncbi:MAG: TVP38/TMEM64 family protein [Planctomycetales bacterium]